ncbi:hypothetical protein WICPIJ_002497 [Wickerhamomyces pijperi]|uniref:Ribonuclease P/MRP protein subunit POP5 n=1 Tax=Wickerhamomyces pijperi TaxID=599730 RepID=A0A9P8QBP5_WICPI|nr:hypothetical protein WICPIJ_002497 [Wickerhamomyces pijperi]
MVRLKSRYILFEIIYPPTSTNITTTSYSLKTSLKLHHQTSTISGRELLQLIRTTLNETYGDFGSGLHASSMNVKYFSPRTSTGILRTARDNFELIIGTLMMIRSVQGKNCIVNVIHVSGTIKMCQDFLIAKNKKLMKLMDGEEDDALMEMDTEVGKLQEDEDEED